MRKAENSSQNRKKKKALVTATVASMIDLFNMDNIRILKQQGYEVHVASNFSFGSVTSRERVDEFYRELKQNGIKAFHIPFPRSICDWKNILASYWKMKRICKKEQYALIHTQSPIGGALTRLAAKQIWKNGTKVIYMAHGFHFYNGAPKKNWLLFYPVEKYLSRFTDVLITINREDYRRAKTFHAKKACYVPGVGVDAGKFGINDGSKEKLRKEFGFRAEDFIVLSVGELSNRKNQEAVIRAVARIKDKDVKYLVAGLGELEEAYQRLIRELGISDRVVLAGYRDDICALLHMADCFVFPSLQEGLPMSLMEAMAAGIPVVCSRIRGNTDLIRDGIEGVLIAPMDVEGYASAILKLKQDCGLADRYRRNAMKRVQRFDAEQIHAKMFGIYNAEG